MKVSALVFIELKNTCRIQKENIENVEDNIDLNGGVSSFPSSCTSFFSICIYICIWT